MGNFELQENEVVLYEGMITSSEFKGNLQIILTSQKIVFEKDKGLFKKERELLDIVFLEDIKFYNGEPQIKQKGSSVTLQTIAKNITLSFSGIVEARKFIGKIINAVTGTTAAMRGADKIKDAFSVVDDTLGLDTRGAIKGLVENGVKGTILNGIRGKKK